MEEKLRRLMKHEGINSTRLAEILGIQASGISHIMSGRNKPSFDFLLKLLQRFPQISPDWLLLDKGPMYRDEIKSKVGGSISTQPISPIVPVAQNTPLTPEMTGLFAEYQGFVDTKTSEPDNNDIISSTEPEPSRQSPVPKPSMRSLSTDVERIVVLYNDKTFSEYQPKGGGNGRND